MFIKSKRNKQILALNNIMLVIQLEQMLNKLSMNNQ